MYSIPAGGFRHPYPALAMNASMSRWVLEGEGPSWAPWSWHWALGHFTAPRAWAQTSPRISGWSPRLKIPPEVVVGPHGWRKRTSHGLRASLGLDQCHHLKAGVGSGGFQVHSWSPAWLWVERRGFGVCRVDLEFLGWIGVALFWGFQRAFGIPACSQGFQRDCVEAGNLSA